MTEDKTYVCPVCGLKQTEYLTPTVTNTVQLWAGGTCSQSCARTLYLVEVFRPLATYLGALATPTFTTVADEMDELLGTSEEVNTDESEAA